jgi:hypothetical protein
MWKVFEVQYKDTAFDFLQVAVDALQIVMDRNLLKLIMFHDRISTKNYIGAINWNITLKL